MPRRVRVAAVHEIPPGTGREVRAGGRVLAVFNVGGRFHCIDAFCPHLGGPLAEGDLDGCVVVCPWHGWQFDVATGRHVPWGVPSGEADLPAGPDAEPEADPGDETDLRVERFPAAVEDGAVWVEIE